MKNGAFSFVGVPFGVYELVVTSRYGTTSRSHVMVNADTDIAIDIPASNALRTIADVSTGNSGVPINVSGASIASISPSEYVFQGNPSWHDLLNQIPGVTVGGGLLAGATSGVVIPNSPFEPVILSINGALPYETSTTFDGMPLSNYTFSSAPGAGVDLSPLAMGLFDTADVVRGPGANAPSIVDSVGGSFVLHAPGQVEANSFEAAMSNDPYEGSNATAKAAFRTGRLSTTIVYGFDNSPGPLANKAQTGALLSVATVNGIPVATGGYVQSYPNPVYGNCFCYTQSTLMIGNYPQSTEWKQHDGGLGLAYQISPTVTAQAFYAGSQASTVQAIAPQTINFTPALGYTGYIAPGNLRAGFAGPETAALQSGSLLEEKVTAYTGTGVLRLAALQNSTYVHQSIPNQASGTYPVYGTGTYCDNPPSCSSTTPFTLNGAPTTVTFFPFTYYLDGVSRNNDLLASYDSQIGARFTFGASVVKSANIADAATTFGTQAANYTTTEYRLHGSALLSQTINLEASYYFARAVYHVPNPVDANQWVDSPFFYSAPRLSFVWRPTRDIAVRAAAGGGFALPPLFDMVGQNGPPTCGGVPVVCTESLTNIDLQPEKAFGFDFGSDVRVARNTALSVDIYRSNLYGQLFQSVRFVGIDPTFHAPTYAQEFLNLAQSRFEGANLSVSHTVQRGLYWKLGLGLSRGYIVSVPQGFYDMVGAKCNFQTGTNCQNTYAVPNQNFNGQYQSTVPYANGAATFGYKWQARQFIELDSNYFGNNNPYFVPAFAEFNLLASTPLSRNVSLLFTYRNLTGIYDEPMQFLQVNPHFVAPSVAGFDFPLYPVPYGPRTLVVTADFHI